jgi:hypothetical protein
LPEEESLLEASAFASEASAASEVHDHAEAGKKAVLGAHPRSRLNIVQAPMHKVFFQNMIGQLS